MLVHKNIIRACVHAYIRAYVGNCLSHLLRLLSETYVSVVALYVSHAVRVKPHCTKSDVFRIKLKLEHERRDMILEASLQRFLLSEAQYRRDRPRRRAYMMLRLCEMYQQACGSEVPFVAVPNTACSGDETRTSCACVATTGTEVQASALAGNAALRRELCRKASYACSSFIM